MIEIHFSDHELFKARELARQRHDAKDISFRNASVIGRQESEYDPHIIGVLGELAWAKFSGQEIDTKIYAVRDSGEDFPHVEVKSITYIGRGEPELKIKKTEYEARTPPSLYVLVKINKKYLNKAQILGTISRASFDEQKKEKQYGKNMPVNYIVPLSVMGKPTDEDKLFL